jgi:hypothetical protein
MSDKISVLRKTQNATDFENMKEYISKEFYAKTLICSLLLKLNLLSYKIQFICNHFALDNTIMKFS